MLKFIEKRAINYFIARQCTPVKLTELDPIGYDSTGKRYFSWNQLEQIPRNRFIAMEQMRMYLDAKISPQTLQEISEAIVKLSQEIATEESVKKRSMQSAQITALATELTFREKYAIPREVLCAVAAIMSVREDEDPAIYNERIQTEKSDQFLKDLDTGNYFFLTSPTMGQLIPSLVMPTEDWKNHLAFLAVQAEPISQRLKTILSGTE